MGNNHDSIALDWVRGEIQDTLTQGQQALEAYVGNREDTARLRFCLNYLHQVHGTLQMVELYGAALLTEEMEKLTQAILNETVANEDDAVEVLMQSILHLPQYLEHLASSKDDFPLVLLPTLNDLRAARGESLLSDTSLFKPDLSPAQIKPVANASQRLQDPKVLGHIRKLRQMYQFALAGVVRESDLNAHFEYMQKVILRLVKLCNKTPRGELWRAAGGFVESLQEQVNPVNTAVTAILREMDAEIRRLIDEHVDILQQPVPEALLKHLLYYVARARDLDTPYIRELRDAYSLNTALPSDDDVDAARNRVSGPGKEAIHSVVSALNEELAKLKDQLDLFVRSELRQNNELDDLLPGLRQVANTLAVLGLGIPRKVVQEQIELVERIINQEEPVDDGTLMDIAGALLYVEASLAGLDSDSGDESGADTETANLGMGSRELSEASQALLRESRNTLEQVKSAIVNFIASQWDTREIDDVPGLLHSIRGGLGLIPLDRASELLASAERYISDVLLGGKQVPDWGQLDTLADAVTSIEYYLERLAEGIHDNDTVLQLAEDSLNSLGFPVGQEPTWQQPTEEAEPALVTEEVPEPAARKESDQELLDDEILEIFVEEAGEVLSTINEYYPRLYQDHGDREALTEVRRAYHTLKGSGRLVGAESIGELAWSVENLLNHIIDGTIRATDDVLALVSDVNQRLPSLIEEFKQGETSGDVVALMERAESLADTRKAEQEPVEQSAESEPTEEAPETAPEEAQESDAEAEEPEDAAGSDAAQAEAAEQPEDDLIDDEILEIFIEEAEEVLGTINEYLPMLLRQFDDRTALSEVRRAFHTLKGSGRMVGASVIGELAWSVENMLNRVIDGSVFMNDDIAGLLQEVTDALPALTEDFEKHRAPSVATAPLEERANALAKGEIPAAAPAPSVSSAETTEATGEESDDDSLVDPVLLDIFESEAETHLQTLKAFLDAAGEKAAVSYTDDVSRALHTLKGSANTAGIEPIARIITPLERFVKEARAENLKADRDALDLLDQSCAFLTRGLAQLRENPQAELEGTDEYLAHLDEVSHRTLGSRSDAESEQQATNTSPQLVQLFLNEGLDIVLDADSILDEWVREPDNRSPLTTLRRELQQLTSSAAEAGLSDVANLSHALEQAYGRAEATNQPAPPEFIDTVRAAHENLINMMDQVAAGLATVSDSGLIYDLEAFGEGDAEPVPDPFDEEFTGDLEAIDESLDDQQAETGEAQGAEQPASEAPAAEEDYDAGADDELAEIFLEEARELIDSTAEALQSWSEDTANMEQLRLLQRDLHTLKGGARLSGIQAVGDLSHELENLFEGLTEERFQVTEQLSELLFSCHDRLAGMVDSLEQHESPRPAPDLIAEIHQYMDSSQDGQATPDQEARSEGTDDTDEIPTPDVSEEAAEEEEAQAYDLSHLDPELVGIFLEEAYDLINSTGSSLHTWSEDPSNREIAAELQRDVHTLKGGARMAGVEPIADLTHVLEDLFEKVAEGQLEATESMQDLLFACHDRLAQMVEQVATGQPCPAANELVNKVKAVLSGEEPAEAAAPAAEEIPESELQEQPTEEVADITPDLAEADDEDLIRIFLDEGLEIRDAISECLTQWKGNPEELVGITELQQELHTLKGGARLADVDPVAELAETWSDALDPLIAGANNQQTLQNLSDKALDALNAMLDSIEEGNKPVLDPALLDDFRSAGNEVAADIQPGDQEGEESAGEPVDLEVLEIFLEEAGEILDQLEQLLDDWRKEPANHQFNQEAQRALHTLKGGARLSQLSDLGNQAHALETRLIDLGGNEPDEAAWQAITEDHDAIVARVAEIRQRYEQGAAVQPADEKAAEKPEEKPAEQPAPEQDKQPEPAKPEAEKKPDEKPAEKTPEKPAPKPAAKKPAQKRDAARSAQETIRVSAPLLDDLVNLAGETSITRSRLEQQNSDFSHTLDEMAATIERLREQLRRMDIETEAQILFRAEKEHGPDYGDDFDPLEMDRYSSIQQLSRALTESSSDLADLRETLADRVRDTETLLVQQSRINTELQEGLMKTRMIPFSSMVPRLRRIVRQISGELGKKVEFDVRNPEGEMDRNILERMVAPLEHMLRNALDHGIENPDDRKKSGKPETGEVTLSLTREGGDVVLRMMDDGKGIPTPVIRDKAIRQGMMTENEQLSDREILQFILQPGFSTAQQVTQISGRGVGMDVVASEIKQLGGSLDIDSKEGHGTTFTVRLPFTVSVNRALMVSTGEDFYAIPLNTIEGIVRVSSYELEEYYKPDAPMYEYAGQEYRLQYLGGLLHSDHHPKLQGQALPLPVILVRGAEQPMALQVDSLMGSREIVVKSLGPQFSSVRGVSGATILGDGNVVVILDLPAMIRSDIISERQRLADLEKAREADQWQERVTRVMVVDDSVTVRKVTSRLLERNGMEVFTAKDGLDAVAQLQDNRPDVILLDIEMPRMDGFEVASFVRHDEALKDTPICMITSRTGEKHRERALAIGVNEYLGKPFQETELLDTILRLTGNK
jgi:chemosensory pili system protein ChpA (sensor histidine kinase/response regulator)